MLELLSDATTVEIAVLSSSRATWPCGIFGSGGSTSLPRFVMKLSRLFDCRVLGEWVKSVVGDTGGWCRGGGGGAGGWGWGAGDGGNGVLTEGRAREWVREGRTACP